MRSCAVWPQTRQHSMSNIKLKCRYIRERFLLTCTCASSGFGFGSVSGGRVSTALTVSVSTRVLLEDGSAVQWWCLIVCIREAAAAGRSEGAVILWGSPSHVIFRRGGWVGRLWWVLRHLLGSLAVVWCCRDCRLYQGWLRELVDPWIVSRHHHGCVPVWFIELLWM